VKEVEAPLAIRYGGTMSTKSQETMVTMDLAQ
jgi:hypothetical protein